LFVDNLLRVSLINSFLHKVSKIFSDYAVKNVYNKLSRKLQNLFFFWEILVWIRLWLCKFHHILYWYWLIIWHLAPFYLGTFYKLKIKWILGFRSTYIFSTCNQIGHEIKRNAILSWNIGSNFDTEKTMAFSLTTEAHTKLFWWNLNVLLYLTFHFLKWLAIKLIKIIIIFLISILNLIRDLIKNFDCYEFH
jgi:hypothetical protein